MRYAFLLLVLFRCSYSTAQLNREYDFIHLDQTNGLYHNTVRNIGQDKRGFIWILTHNGLQRYDGYRFKNYPEITQKSSFAIIKDSELYVDTIRNQVWVSNGRESGRLDLQSNTMTNVHIEELLKKGGAMEGDVFRLEKGGHVIINQIGYIHYRSMQGLPDIIQFNVNPEQSNRSTNIVRDPDSKNYWTHDFYHFLIGDVHSGEMISSGSIHHHPLLRQLTDRFGDHMRIRYLLLDSHRNLWISTWKEHFMRYNLDNHELTIYSLKDIKRKQPGQDKSNATLLVQVMYEDRQGTLWIGTDFAGLLAYDHDRDDFDFIISDDVNSNGLRYSFSIYAIFQDRDNNLWVGTDRGINIFNPYKNYFQILRHAKDHDNVYAGYSVNDVIETNTGEILIATWGGGISVYDPDWNFLKNIRFHESPEHNLVWCFIEHDNGVIWAGTQKGYIHEYDPVLKTLKTIHPEAIQNSTIIKMRKDPDGNILMGLHNGKIAVWNKKENYFLSYDDTNPDPKVRFPGIKNMYVDDEGRGWIATGSGLREFDIGKLIYLDIYQPDSTDVAAGISFTGIETYNDSMLMIGSIYRGVYLFNRHTKKFSREAIFNPLNNTSIFAIRKDKPGNYWMTTDYALIKVDPKLAEPTIMKLDHTLMESAFDAVSFCEIQDGRWLTASSAEVMGFDPNEITTQLEITPDVQISGFRVLNKPLYIDSFLHQHKPVILPYDHNFISIEFSSLDFTDLRQTNYVYRLSGVNKDWIHTSSSQVAEYTDLKPGEYTFEIKAGQGKGYSNITSFPIVIKPPWWGTAGFRISAALAVIAFCYWMFRKRIQQIRQQSALRHRVAEMEMKALRAQMNPHFIFNCLSSIDNLIQTDQKTKATDYLAKFASLIRAILENSKANAIPCWKDLEALKLYLELESLRWENQIICHLNIETQIQEGDYKVPPLVIQPFVENAIHHGLLNKLDGVKTLDIDVRKEDHLIKYTITDNGVGRVQAAVYKKVNKLSQASYGVQMTNERIGLFNQEENGSIRITDLYDSESMPTGTMVEVWLKTQPTW